MNPNHEEQPEIIPPEGAPAMRPAQSTKPAKTSLKLPIFLMLLPGVLLVGSILLYAVANFISGSVAPEPATTGAESLFEDSAPNPVMVVANVILFLVGAASLLGGFPCFVIGIVLLVQRLSARSNAKN